MSWRTANNKLTKLYWPSRKRSQKRLIVEGQDICPPFKFVPAPLFAGMRYLFLKFRLDQLTSSCRHITFQSGFRAPLLGLKYIVHFRQMSTFTSRHNCDYTNLRTMCDHNQIWLEWQINSRASDSVSVFAFHITCMKNADRFTDSVNFRPSTRLEFRETSRKTVQQNL